MISLIYFIITIVLSLIFGSWELFFIMLLVWVLWMTFRFAVKNGATSYDGGDAWMFYDVETSVNDSFGGGEFGGGGASGDSSDSSSDSSGSCSGGSSCGGCGGD